MLKKILIILVLALGVFAGVAAIQPDDFRVTRTAAINAPVEKLFTLVNTQKQWNLWSPWAKLDPNATFTFEGPEAGVGAVSKWSGNWEVGEGMSTITESRPNEFVKFRLDFLKPMKSTSTTEFLFKQENGQTNVTWTMYGKNNFVAKAIGLIMNCEKMVGQQFDQGLANLKLEAEKN